ncbi:MAG: A24 family peptidase [Lachnospiraceae bacterium]|nr:A24 family peptidase [Lachnospiraceae bacterium]
MESISLLGMLGVISAEDMKTHKIRDLLILLFSIIGIMFHLIYQRLDVLDMIGGMAVGGAIYLYSICSNGKIGKGDALVFVLTGIYLGLKNNMLLVWGSALILSVFGMGACLVGKKKITDKIAFVPFIFLTYFLILLWEGGLPIG